MIIACRDSGHLAWRFARHPINKYRFFALQRGDEVYRYEAFYIEGDRCYINDVLCRHVAGLPAKLIHALVAHQRDAGTAMSIVVQINENFVSTLSLGRIGFVRRHDFQRVMVKPRADGAEREFLNSRVRREKAASFQWVRDPPGECSSRKQPERLWR